MINPNKIHRSRAVISEIKGNGSVYSVTVPSGHKIIGWDLPSKFKLGESVNVQSSFSIVLDKYTIKTINKIKIRK